MLYVSTPKMTLHHINSIPAFSTLKILHMDRQATHAEAMDDTAFSIIGSLTQLEELVLALQLTNVSDRGFLRGLGPLRSLRRLECFGVERVGSLLQAWDIRPSNQQDHRPGT